MDKFAIEFTFLFITEGFQVPLIRIWSKSAATASLTLFIELFLFFFGIAHFLKLIRCKREKFSLFSANHILIWSSAGNFRSMCTIFNSAGIPDFSLGDLSLSFDHYHYNLSSNEIYTLYNTFTCYITHYVIDLKYVKALKIMTLVSLIMQNNYFDFLNYNLYNIIELYKTLHNKTDFDWIPAPS